MLGKIHTLWALGKNVQTMLSPNDWKLRMFIDKSMKVFKSKLFGKNQDNFTIVVKSALDVKGFPFDHAAGLATKLNEDTYLIALNYKFIRNKGEMLGVIAHEMGHIQQFVAGDLEEREDGIMWRNRVFSHVNMAHSIVGDWSHRPWEQHAEGVKEFLLKTYGEEILNG